MEEGSEIVKQRRECENEKRICCYYEKWSVFCGDKKESMRGREEGLKEKGCLSNLILEKR